MVNPTLHLFIVPTSVLGRLSTRLEKRCRGFACSSMSISEIRLCLARSVFIPKVFSGVRALCRPQVLTLNPDGLYLHERHFVHRDAMLVHDCAPWLQWRIFVMIQHAKASYNCFHLCGNNLGKTHIWAIGRCQTFDHCIFY